MLDTMEKKVGSLFMLDNMEKEVGSLFMLDTMEIKVGSLYCWQGFISCLSRDSNFDL
jgi:hypothetical protein